MSVLSLCGGGVSLGLSQGGRRGSLGGKLQVKPKRVKGWGGGSPKARSSVNLSSFSVCRCSISPARGSSWTQSCRTRRRRSSCSYGSFRRVSMNYSLNYKVVKGTCRCIISSNSSSSSRSIFFFCPTRRRRSGCSSGSCRCALIRG